MIGPSSSHTAGAARIGYITGFLCNHLPSEIELYFHGSLASTYSFHQTDTGLIAGLLGNREDSTEIRRAYDIANERNIPIKIDTIQLKEAHPSSMVIKLKCADNRYFSVQAATVGGGNVEINSINDCKVNINGKSAYIYIMMNRDINIQNIIEQVALRNHFTRADYIAGETSKTREEISEVMDENQIETYVYFDHLDLPRNPEQTFFTSFSKMVEESIERDLSLSEIVIDYEAKNSGRSRDEVVTQMIDLLDSMERSINEGVEQEHMLANMFPMTAQKMDSFLNENRSLLSSNVTEIIRNALSVMNLNASMGRIVACPTAGSAGTVPAALFTILKENNISIKRAAKSMFVGAGVGILFAENATISGSMGGCQAETGVAAAMAAAIITDLFNGDAKAIESAASLALGNVLGLVCDPIAGAVEIPCMQRNVLGAMNAVVSAEMALAGIDAVVPLDEMIKAMKEVSDMMDPALKDTLGGGISNTKTARRIEHSLRIGG